MTQQGNLNGGRAGGAPEPIEFDEADTDISDIKWIDAPGILVFWVLAIVVFLQFYTRYVLNDSLIWTEEAARYLLILACFVGSVSAVRRGSHITLEFFIRKAPPKIGKAMAVVSQLITFGFFGALTWIGVGLTQKTRQQMVSLPIPKAWIYTICVIALGIMTIYSAIWLWRRWLQTPEEIIQSLDSSLGAD